MVTSPALFMMQWLKSWCEAVTLVYKAESLKPALQKTFEDAILQKLVSILMFSPTDASGGVEMVVSLQIKRYCISFPDSVEQEAGWAEIHCLAPEVLSLFLNWVLQWNK